MKTKPIFLFSVDLEDVRLRVTNGLSYSPQVEKMIDLYLGFLSEYNAKATFFTVGNITTHYPGLIAKIVKEGHEIACHSDQHVPVTLQSKTEFKEDLLVNRKKLLENGAEKIVGYRAPTFSLTQQTSWVYEILSELNFTYSSSVLPEHNPLFGWKDFGHQPKKMNRTIWELPMNINKYVYPKTPFAGGVYFRVLPFYIIKKNFEHYFSRNMVVNSYFHPYDVDTEQENFMHPEIHNNLFYNTLMYYNRKNVFHRLRKIMNIFKPKIMPYSEYVSLLHNHEH